MLLLFDAHFVQNFIVFAYVKRVEVLLHSKVFTDIAAFQPSSKVVGHKPTNNVAAKRDCFTDDVKPCFIVF